MILLRLISQLWILVQIVDDVSLALLDKTFEEIVFSQASNLRGGKLIEGIRVDGFHVGDTNESYNDEDC